MGFKHELFTNLLLGEHLTCAICKLIVENPICYGDADHLACRTCFENWIKTTGLCFFDSKAVDASEIKPPPMVITKLLYGLRVKCDFANRGCSLELKVEDLVDHVLECPFMPPKAVATQVDMVFDPEFEEMVKGRKADAERIKNLELEVVGLRNVNNQLQVRQMAMIQKMWEEKNATLRLRRVIALTGIGKLCARKKVVKAVISDLETGSRFFQGSSRAIKDLETNVDD